MEEDFSVPLSLNALFLCFLFIQPICSTLLPSTPTVLCPYGLLHTTEGKTYCSHHIWWRGQMSCTWSFLVL